MKNGTIYKVGFALIALTLLSGCAQQKTLKNEQQMREAGEYYRLDEKGKNNPHKGFLNWTQKDKKQVRKDAY